MKLFMTALAALTPMLMSFSGCYAGGKTVINPSKTYVTKKVNISDVESISASRSVDVVYTQHSGEPYAEIYAPDNVAQYVKVEQDGKKLNVTYDFPKGHSLSIRGKYTCEVRVFAPEVTGFYTSSSSDITLANGLNTNKDVTFNTSSSGDIHADKVQCGNLTASTTSSGELILKNITCHDVVMNTESSGDILVEDMACTQANVQVSSSGDCKVSGIKCEGNMQIESSSSGDCKIENIACKGDVSASSGSAGDVRLSGICRNATYEASSAGNVYAEGLKAIDVKAHASSAGDVRCHVTGKLSAGSSSAGSVRYAGNPTSIEGKIKGVSRL